ncbi:MAG: type IV pilin N-terminal domain-containing protein [Methanocorpusculum sp.]|nr:type IV pilin N-terminal domain-containing protein [Methanocorpusculum sp.]MBQ4597242.1 type IV pilin N-terminal domain-containing protein [Methanocorpusculum sp.]
MNLKKSDDAISPVIGVMLMLVITVVIAAVVTMFATGVVGDTEPAPVATFDVKILTKYNSGDGIGPDFQIKKLSGDDIDTKDIEIRVSWTDQNGNSHYSSYSADKFKDGKMYEKLPAWGWKISQPLYVEATGQSFSIRSDYTISGYEKSDRNNYFGNVILKPGLTLTAGVECVWTQGGGSEYVGNQFMDAIFNNGEILITSDPRNEEGIMKYLPEGTAVDVMFIHLPSNKVIYDNTVIVQ